MICCPSVTFVFGRPTDRLSNGERIWFGRPSGHNGGHYEAWWRRRESNPRPKAFDNDVYMRIRVVTGIRARGRLSLFRPRGASTRRIAPQDLSLSLTGGSGGPPAKPAWSTSFPARQAWSGRTWLKQPVPDQCWLFLFFHHLREMEPRHAVVASCTFVEPSTPPPRASQAAIPGPKTGPGSRWGQLPRTQNRVANRLGL